MKDVEYFYILLSNAVNQGDLSLPLFEVVLVPTVYI